MRPPCWRIFGALLGVAWACAAQGTPTDADIKFFESQVRPLLADNCFGCHGERKQKGGLRLDSAAAIALGGKNGPVITPGHAADSKLIRAVSYADKDLQMPPEEQGQLSAAQIATLTQWVDRGAFFTNDGGGDLAVV